MSEGSLALPQVRTFRPGPEFFRLVPGVLLLAAIGWLGKFVEQSLAAYAKAHQVHLPNIEYALWAIVFGMAISNTVGVPVVFQPGVTTYEFWLKAGIVLLGSRFLLGDVLKLGGISLALVLLERRGVLLHDVARKMVPSEAEVNQPAGRGFGSLWGIGDHRD